MISLGLNGWTDRTHDSAAALVVDGEVVAFVEQERLSRRKHGVGELAHAAVQEVLHIAGLSEGDIDTVSYGWDLELFNATRSRPIDLSPETIGRRITGLELRPGVTVNWVGHHDAHAASAFFGSGNESAAVLVVDAEGENCSTSIYRGSGSELTLLRRFGRGGSLGLLYRATSEYCGFGQDGAGKAMGLAAYAKGDAEAIPLEFDGTDIVSPFADDDAEDTIIEGWLRILTARFGPPAVQSHTAGFPPLENHRPQAAASVQARVEQLLVALAGHAVSLTGETRLCMAGGVALNCVSNGLIVNTVAGLHIPPATHDAGVALGAALWTLAECGEKTPATTEAALGRGWTTSDVVAACRATNTPFAIVDDPAAAAAGMLVAGDTIAWFQGRMEVGPRALGHRSILALPGVEETRFVLNEKKGREPWRPLAPSLLSEETDRMFGCQIESPFMLMSRELTDAGAAAAPACRHHDGSARYHTVPADSTTEYRRLLENLQHRTGVGAVLNTSFNTRGEPIVNTPAEAIVAWRKIGLDALVAEHVVVG